MQDTKNTFDQNQPKLQGFSTDMQDTYGRLAPGSEAGIVGAQSVVNRNLSGANLTGNPYLEGIIGKTRRNVTDQANSQFTAAGRYGSGAHSATLGRELADAENSLRYQDYGVERGYQQGAIGDAQNLMGGATGLLNNAAQLPWVGVQAQNGGTNSLTNGYGVTTSKTSGLGNVIEGIGSAAKAAGSIASTVGMFASDERMKNVGPRVGTSLDNIPLYEYAYKDDPAQTPQVGPMAQDVEQVRPDAVAQAPDGSKMVDFNKIAAPAPTVAPNGNPFMPNLAETRQNVPDIKRPRMGLIGTLRDDPTLAKPENAARLFWARLGAASGNPLGEAVVGGRNDALQQQGEERQIAMNEQSARDMAEYRKAMAARGNEPPAPTANMQDWQAYSAMTPDQQRAYREMRSPGGAALVPTAKGYQPRDKAVGMMPYRAPPAARGGGGGVPAASAARYRADAAAAIARGADPAKVNARLAQIMGGN